MLKVVRAWPDCGRAFIGAAPHAASSLRCPGFPTADVLAFALGAGPVVGLLSAELAPERIRGRAVSVAMLAHWTFNFLLGATFLAATQVAQDVEREPPRLGGRFVSSCCSDQCSFPPRVPSFLLQAVGVAAVYTFFAAVALLGSLFVRAFIPETKGRSSSEIEAFFSRTPGPGALQ